YLSDDIPASIIDRYADSILLNIAYHFDGSDPLRSVMISEYYYTDYKNENNNLLDSVRDGLTPNKEYLRYWHGSAALVRAAHCLTDIRGMYIFGAAALVILNALLLFVLIKQKLYAGAVGTVCALAAAGIWYVPFSLEYTWIFLIAPVISLISVRLSINGRKDMLGLLFMIAGIITNYFDFLTAETLTLTLPLLLALYTLRAKAAVGAKPEALTALRLCCAWAAGYAGMWVLKWLLAAAVLGEDVMPYVLSHISARTVGELAYGEADILSAFVRNFGCLFPFGYTGVGIFAGIVLILAVVYVCYVYHRDGIKVSDILIYAVIGAVPLLRYAVMLSHSYLHYFFTYRAQAAGVLAVCLIISEITGFGRKKQERRKRR
ncbi:MAG: hypothetical protein J6X60_08850, partial [Ruminiclostridium sp.]|nr:hypothetical protein [Ruminiclostridium sp.]